MAGNPTKYGPETVERIVQAVRAGLTNKDAALVAGIHENTMIAWHKRHRDFRDRLAQAHAQRAAMWLAKLQQAGEGDWRAYAELLDRCAPEYRKTERRELTGADGGPIRHDHTHRDLSSFSDDEIDALAAMVERRRAGELVS